MKQLGQPTLFCHRLEADGAGYVRAYRLRMSDQKRHAVEAFRKLNFKVVAAGDSYNDTTMLAAAHAGIFFCPPESIARQFPQFPVTRDYDALGAAIDRAMANVH
jgi:phosphoserine/homoserine phosphotransferase